MCHYNIKMNIDLSILNNEYLLAGIAIFVAIYVSQERVELPSWVKSLFKNDIFRVVFLFCILFFNLNSAPHVALIMALVFVITLDYILKEDTREQFTHLETFLAEESKSVAPMAENKKLGFIRTFLNSLKL